MTSTSHARELARLTDQEAVTELVGQAIDLGRSLYKNDGRKSPQRGAELEELAKRQRDILRRIREARGKKRNATKTPRLTTAR